MTFTLLNVDGTVLWTEDHPAVPVNRGLFHVLLGKTTALSPALFAGGPVDLKVTVDGKAIEPTTKLAGVPFAFRAQTSVAAETAARAEAAARSDHAALADRAEAAARSDHAALADRAVLADKATLAFKATLADKSTASDKATLADRAILATKAETIDGVFGGAATPLRIEADQTGFGLNRDLLVAGTENVYAIPIRFKKPFNRRPALTVTPEWNWSGTVPVTTNFIDEGGKIVGFRAFFFNLPAPSTEKGQSFSWMAVGPG